MTTLIVVATAVYLIGNLVIGSWRLKPSDWEGFVSSRNSFSRTFVALSLAGSVVSGGMFFVVTQMGYEAGVAVLVLPVSYLLGYALLTFAAPRIRAALKAADGNTLYDVVYHRLGHGKRLTEIFVLLLALAYFGMYFFLLAGQFTVLASFYISIFAPAATQNPPLVATPKSPTLS